MPTTKTKKKGPLVIQGYNRNGKLIEASVPSGEVLTAESLNEVQQMLAKHKDIKPTPVPAS